MANTIYWYNLLTREHMFCTMCYRDAQLAFIAETKAGLPHPPEREPWVRIANPEWFSHEGLSMSNPRTRASYIAKLKAAFRRHVTEVHPVLPFQIGWSRTA